MARTSRGGAPAGPAMDAGALDDLDLDDMFAEDGDTLFEGLDIQLDGMGDIINDEQKEQKDQKEQKTESNKRASGPKTKKTNPLLEEAAADSGVPKRRKTKRKSKAPTAFGDEDEDYVEDAQPKKKQRKAAANRKTAAPVASPVAQTKKKKSKKSETPPVVSTSSPPAKTKKSSATVPPPATLSRGSSATVAAAGQFGGRLKRGASLPTNKVKRKLKGMSPTAASAPASTASQPAPAPAPAAPPPAAQIKLPKPEATYGGLAPSKTHFYPFMESVPPEPSLKNRKAYPVLDRIGSNLTSHLNAVPPKDSTTDISMDSPIFKLLVETYEGGNEKERASFTPEKRMALLHAIPKVRETIQTMERQRLVGDLYAMCGLLARQHSFLKQTLQNMKDWCKAEFAPQDYNATYAKPIPKDSTPSAPHITPKADAPKWPTTFIKVKVVCSSFKEPKGTPPLTAMLPAHVVVPPPAKSTPTAASKKKKKEKPSEKPKVSPPVATAPAPVPAVKAYADCSPIERRQRITEMVSQLALQLEEQESKAQHTQKPPEPLPDEEPPLHTARMWQWLDSAGFYNSLPPNGLDLQSPEIHPRGLFLSNPTKIQGHDDQVDETSSNSLFDRLQSLLVEVDGEHDDLDEKSDSDDESDAGESSDEECLGFLDEDEDENKAPESKGKSAMADLSNLSLEERTFIFLRRVGLIQDSVFPMVELVLSSNEEEKKVKAEDDLVNVIGEMSNDLSQLTTRNNARFAFLESALSGSDQLHNKQTEEENASIIARCQNLLKRSKEKAKKVKQKKDDNLNLPW